MDTWELDGTLIDDKNQCVQLVTKGIAICPGPGSGPGPGPGSGPGPSLVLFLLFLLVEQKNT